MENWTYPRINALFHALIAVEVNLLGLGTYLRDDLQRRTRPGLGERDYFPTARVIERVTGRPPMPHEVARRAELERAPCAGLRDTDAFWDWWVILRDASDAAKQAVTNAVPDLDVGEPNILNRHSTHLREVLLRAENSTNFYTVHGWNPYRLPAESPDWMMEAIKLLVDWREKLRPIAFLDGPSPKRAAKRKSQRTSSAARRERPLTAVQNTTIQIVSKHQGNFSAAADELGKDRKTVIENWKLGMAKLERSGYRPSRSVSASRLPTDRRGQEDVEEPGG